MKHLVVITAAALMIAGIAWFCWFRIPQHALGGFPGTIVGKWEALECSESLGMPVWVESRCYEFRDDGTFLLHLNRNPQCSFARNFRFEGTYTISTGSLTVRFSDSGETGEAPYPPRADHLELGFGSGGGPLRLIPVSRFISE